ncbi:TonB-linked outer membrane protein, SusC/RagA family [Daejeonella lutea]|uniref:TonB-linked outer membrane protein, SusC/RagA family n=2 Tax=Daejeonella lutea TaxID=572036 RepID=A0A1T5BTQ5_9SPHI|nr:TonB-linked outer membrane protein, SusC/RagA family [Daejeonella lutea]
MLLLLGVLISQFTIAQTRAISGTVKGDDGLPLPGVSIRVKNTSAGTTTSSTGQYVLQVPRGASQLEFSYVSYKTQLITIGSSDVINVTLVTDLTMLNEIVVTAGGVKRNKADLGYSVATVSSEELITGRTSNPVNALAGKVAGVRVASTSGSVGSSSSIFIRGFTTFTGSNQPLFVVDGVPIDNTGGLNSINSGVTNSNRAIDINQDDIENMSILKGPAAAALYGSRGSNGVILITTKKGKTGAKNSVEYNSSFNLVEPNVLPDYQNTYAQGTGGTYSANSILSWGPEIKGQAVTNFLGTTENLTVYPNNVEDIFRQGHNLQNNVSFQGGTDRSNYRLSYGNLQEKGYLTNNDLKRNNFTLNASSQVAPKFLVGVSAQYVLSNSSRSQFGNQTSNPFFRAYFLPRSYDLKNYPTETADGSPIYFDATDNPIWTLKNNTYDDVVNRVIGNANFKYDVLPWMSLNYRLGVDSYGLDALSYDQIGARGNGSTSASSTGGILNEALNSRDINSYFQIIGSRNITKDLRADFNIGNEIVERNYSYTSTTGKSLSIRDLKNVSNAATITASNSKSQTRLIGLFGELNFGYKGFANLSFTGRNDYSSTFGAANNSYFYPSVAGSFTATEAFPGLKNNILSFLKVSANYAKVGKEAGAYATNTVFVQASASDGFGPAIAFPYNSLNGRSLSNIQRDPNLKPEFTASKEIGLEIRFLKDRLAIEANAYRTSSTDLIFEVPVGPSTGFQSQNRNAGTLKQKGFELMLSGTPLKTQNGAWTVSANWSKITPTVESLAPGVAFIQLGGFVSPGTRLYAGQPYGLLFGSKFNRAPDGKLLIGANGLTSLSPTLGAIGNTNPDWTAGITNNIRIKNFNTSFLLDIRKGGDIYSRNIGDIYRTGVAKETAEFARLDAAGVQTKPYVIEGTLANGQPNTTPVTAQAYWDNLYAFGLGESYVFDGSWFRVREVSVSYTLPAKLLQKTPVGKLEIGVNGRNLYLYAPNFPHFDPETAAQGVSNSQGFTSNDLPQARNYGFFLRATL